MSRIRSGHLALACLLAGCCAPPRGMGIAYNRRLELQKRVRFGVVAPVLDDSRAWGYGAPHAALLARAAEYRAPGVAPVGSAAKAPRLLPPTEAPPRVSAALAAARTVLAKKGYREATGEDGAEFVLAVGISWYDDGRLARVAVHVGGELDGRFDPYLISMAAVVPEQEACPADVAELTRLLVGALPDRDD